MVYFLDKTTGVIKTNDYFKNIKNDNIVSFSSFNQIREFYEQELLTHKINHFNPNTKFLERLSIIVNNDRNEIDLEEYLNFLILDDVLNEIFGKIDPFNDLNFVSNLLKYKAIGENKSFSFLCKNFIDKYISNDFIKDFFQQDFNTPIVLNFKKVVAVCNNLWRYKSSSFHWWSKFLLLDDCFTKIDYSEQKNNSIKVFDSLKEAKRMCIDTSGFKDNIVSFDVETDTSFGCGLRPLKTRITDVVVSSIDKTWVISGNEKFVLEELCKVFSLFDSSYVFYGWNNNNFDNIVLQTRMEVNEISEWNFSLNSTVDYSMYEPVGPLFDSYELYGINDVKDVFQILNKREQWFNNDYFYKGLKKYCKDLGCSPYVLDRKSLHLCSQQDRQRYVLSDGLLTLFSASQI